MQAFIIGIIGILLSQNNTEARPLYAAKNRIHCSHCHKNVWGGGPRTVMGKVVGSYGFKPGKHSITDWYYADMRANAYFPEKPTKSGASRSSGLGLMQAAIAANTVIQEFKNGDSLMALASYDFAGFARGPREVFLRWDIVRESKTPIQITFGRIIAPFGLLTDEHRTLTKIQNKSSWIDFDLGVVASVNFLRDRLHVDAGALQGFQSGGNFASEDVTYAGILNLRYQFIGAPLLIGTSARFDRTKTNQPSPYSYVLYQALSFDSLTGGWLKGGLTNEIVLARHWNRSSRNSNLTKYLTGDTNFLNAVEGNQSIGSASKVTFGLSERLLLTYKFETLALNSNFFNDGFIRHGFGLRWNMWSNMNLIVRREQAQPLRPGILEEELPSGINVNYAVLHFWL